MTCPACGTDVRGGSERCPACGSLVAPASLGALAPKPEPLRELPGTRKKEKTWRDEVNERVRSRRKKRESETGLPLFDGIPDPPPTSVPEANTEGAIPATEPARLQDARLLGGLEEAVGDLPLRRDDLERAASALETDGAGMGRQDPAPSRSAPIAPPPVREVPSPLVELGDEPAPTVEDEWRLELHPRAPESRPLERPALFVERLQAGTVDFLSWLLLSLVVTYFAGRAAQVRWSGLLPAWPWLLGYLAFLGLAYATYFSGTTGQTPGKMLFGLRVVDSAGQPPGYLRAFLRAALGFLGVSAVGLGLVPIAFDPALRALHDRLCRTRVIRS